MNRLAIQALLAAVQERYTRTLAMGHYQAAECLSRVLTGLYAARGDCWLQNGK